MTENRHRYVFAQINGPRINVLPNLEPIRPGEEECAAALRLLGRLRRVYGPRFFDAITADAWYARGPFLRAVEKLGWAWMVVLKREDMEVYQEARQLSQGRQPRLAFEDPSRNRQVRPWEVKDLASSELPQSYHLEHGDHHEPASLLAQMFIFLLGGTLFTALGELPIHVSRQRATRSRADNSPPGGSKPRATLPSAIAVGRAGVLPTRERTLEFVSTWRFQEPPRF